MDTDAELLDAWRAGDRTAGRTLFERYIGVVSLFFRNKIDDEREELVQRTFLACVESRDQIRSGSTFRAYVLRVARNKLYDHLAARARAQRIDPMTTSVLAVGASPSAVVAQAQRDALLLRALKELPVAMQVALELHYWEGSSMNEIAEVLDVALPTAKSRVLRAREQLRDNLCRLLAGGVEVSRLDADLDGWARELRAALEGGDAAAG